MFRSKGNYHSSYSAESEALSEAFKNIPQEVKDNQNKPVVIFTDLLSNLATIEIGRDDAPEQDELFSTLN